MKSILKDELNNKVPINDVNLNRIINFYLIESPVEGRSARGKTFYQQGWRGTKFSTLKKLMLKNSSDLKENYYPSKKEELAENFKKCENLSKEYAVFLKTDDKTVIQSLYGAIRNAIAHGSFDVRKYKGKKVYFFANYHKYLKAKIVLNEDTLLNWIDVFKSI